MDTNPLTTTLAIAPSSPSTPAVDVEIAIPVYNELADLESSVRRLRRYLDDNVRFRALVTIADNASLDGTTELARRLATEIPGVRAVHLDQKGRGRALRTVWAASTARVVAYMDVDLSTDLDALAPLIAPLLSGHSDVAIGSRLATGAHVVRGPKREFISRGYNDLLHATLGVHFHDAQCGFKAVRTDVARWLVPEIVDQAWFFDTELLVRAERAGLRIHEVPVDWVDDPDSRVKVASTALEDLRGIKRLVRGSWLGEPTMQRRSAPDPTGTASVRFIGTDTTATVIHLGIFASLFGLFGALGLFGSAIAPIANLAALAFVGAVTLRHPPRRPGHGLSGAARGRARRRHLVTALLAATLTTGAVTVAGAAGLTSLLMSGAVLVAASAAAVVVRFALAHAWMLADTTAQIEAVRVASPAGPTGSALAA